MRSAPTPIRHAVTFSLFLAVSGVGTRAAAQQPMQAGGLAPPPPMQTGGLAPPPPGSGPPPPAPMYPNATQRRLEDAEHDDSGRGLEFFYFSARGGAQLIALDALGQSGTFIAPAYGEKPSGIGPYLSVGSGIRLLFLTVGPSFRFAHFGNWDLWSLNLDLGWHIPLGNLEPYALIGGGFTKLGHPDSASAGGLDLSQSGFDIRLGGGVDYYLSSVFSVGGTLEADLVRLSRGNIVNASGNMLLGDASSWGLAVNAGAAAGLHF